MLLPDRINKLIGRAMHDYAMLANGDKVLVAVSGGIDSLLLVHVLTAWLKKAPLTYTLFPVHVDMAGSAENPSSYVHTLKQILRHIGLNLQVFHVPAGAKIQEDGCFSCARARRSVLFTAAKEQGCNKLALGHHMDDIIETFLLNLTCAGNISTMRPSQSLFDGRLTVIRPFAYIEKKDIEELAHQQMLFALATCCAQDGKSMRAAAKRLAADIYVRIPGAKKSIFAALGNVRRDYLLNATTGI